MKKFNLETFDETYHSGKNFEDSMSRFLFFRFFFVALVAVGLVAGVISLVQLCK